jgi:hypothetical protein
LKTKRLLHGIFEFNCLYMYTHVYSFRSFLFIGVSKKVFLFVEAPLSTNKKFFIVRLFRNFSSRHLLILFNKRNTSSILRFISKKFFLFRYLIILLLQVKKKSTTFSYKSNIFCIISIKNKRKCVLLF